LLVKEDFVLMTAKQDSTRVKARSNGPGGKALIERQSEKAAQRAV
jgi:hypothetical protein